MFKELATVYLFRLKWRVFAVIDDVSIEAYLFLPLDAWSRFCFVCLKFLA